MHARWSANQSITQAAFNLIPNEVVRSRGGILLNPTTGFITLPALDPRDVENGSYYELSCMIVIGWATAPPGDTVYAWMDENNVILPDSTEGEQNSINTNLSLSATAFAYATIAPEEDINVHLRTESSNGSASVIASSYVLVKEVI